MPFVRPTVGVGNRCMAQNEEGSRALPPREPNLNRRESTFPPWNDQKQDTVDCAAENRPQARHCLIPVGSAVDRVQKRRLLAPRGGQGISRTHFRFLYLFSDSGQRFLAFPCQREEHVRIPPLAKVSHYSL